MSTQRFLRFVISAAALAVMFQGFLGCALHQAPDTAVLQYGSTVLEAVTTLQKGITAATDAKALPVPTAQKLTGYVEQVYRKSGNLGNALKAYHGATTLSVRELKAGEIQAILGEINTLMARVLGEALPEGALRQISLLVGNVLQAVSVVQAEVAKGLGK